jgi:hypothetical protein
MDNVQRDGHFKCRSMPIVSVFVMTSKVREISGDDLQMLCMDLDIVLFLGYFYINGVDLVSELGGVTINHL